MKLSEAEALFRAEKIGELASTTSGRRFLKIRSFSRGEYLKRFIDKHKIETGSTARLMFEAAFASKINDKSIDEFIREIYEAERKARQADEDKLVNELYKLEVFDWGGLHQNSLEKTIVDNYIKRIQSYNQLEKKIEGELHNSLRGYVLCSWYNHWTSILIEDIFRDHKSVLPAIGQVKKIDFFVGNVPFDLKVTYLPEGYVAATRREDELRPELTLLKGVARDHKIPHDLTMASSKLLEDLWKKVSDHPSKECQTLIKELKAKRNEILESAKKDPQDLIRWLYENQGMRRFDASNRLFVILVDQDDFFSSWKLKRAVPRLKQQIKAYLDNVGDNPGKQIKFTWEGDEFIARSDVVLITKPR